MSEPVCHTKKKKIEWEMYGVRAYRKTYRGLGKNEGGEGSEEGKDGKGFHDGGGERKDQ